MKIRRSFKFLWVLLMMFALTTISYSKNVVSENIPLQDRIFILSKTYSSINLYFAHWKGIPGFSLDSAYKEYLGKVIATDKRFSFDMIMLEFMSKLRNGHSGFSDRWLWRNFGQPLGFRFRYISGKWVITKSYLKTLRPGDIITRINDIEFERFYRGKAKYISASSDREARLKLQFNTYLFPEEFTIKTADGRVIKINRKAQKIARLEAKTTGKWIEEGKIAYIKIPGFSSPVFEKRAIEYVKSFRGARVLIIDVRRNGGGTTPGELVDVLQDRPYRFWRESTPVIFGLFKAYENAFKMFGKHLSKDYKTALGMFSEFFGNSHLMWTPSFQKPEKNIFQGKLILLVDRGCASACEDFVVPFKDNGRAVIIGERTMGSSGQPYIYSFNKDIFIAIGTKREYMPDGSLFEGIGIAPDIKVQPSLDNIKKGKDVVLEEAIKVAVK